MNLVIFTTIILPFSLFLPLSMVARGSTGTYAQNKLFGTTWKFSDTGWHWLTAASLIILYGITRSSPLKLEFQQWRRKLHETGICRRTFSGRVIVSDGDLRYFIKSFVIIYRLMNLVDTNMAISQLPKNHVAENYMHFVLWMSSSVYQVGISLCFQSSSTTPSGPLMRKWQVRPSRK